MEEKDTEIIGGLLVYSYLCAENKRHINKKRMKEGFLFGASLKDAGKKLFAYIKMQETPATELLSNIK